MYLSLREGVLHLFGEELSCRTTRDYAHYAFDLRGKIAEVAAASPWHKALVLPNSWQPDGSLMALLTFREGCLYSVAMLALHKEARLEEMEGYHDYVHRLTNHGQSAKRFAWGRVFLQQGPPVEQEWFIVEFEAEEPAECAEAPSVAQ